MRCVNEESQRRLIHFYIALRPHFTCGPVAVHLQKNELLLKKLFY